MESWLMPMLCGKADVVPEGDDWVAEPKLDGWRAAAYINVVRGVELYCGRNGSEYSGKLPYIDEPLAAMFGADTAIDGELIGGEWGDVQGVMTRGNGPHVPSKAVPALTYVVFDITRVAGNDLRATPWHERRELLETAFKLAESNGVTTPLLQLVPVGPSNQEALEQMLHLGMEGIVCKRKRSPYVNKRANHWIKIKPQDTEDATLVGFYEPEAGSKYDGNSVGGICFKVAPEVYKRLAEDTGMSFTSEVLAKGYQGRAAGMDDPLRQEMFEHPDRFLERTVELAHHGIQARTGALRHPQFKRFRDDKDPAPVAAPKRAPRASGPSKRNYGAMGDPKLLKVRTQLQAGHAEAVAKAGGPENVERDLAIVEQLIAERGL